jgi:hypothetical protein
MNSLYLTTNDRAEELLERTLDASAANRTCAQVVTAENRRINSPLQQPTFSFIASGSRCAIRYVGYRAAARCGERALPSAPNLSRAIRCPGVVGRGVPTAPGMPIVSFTTNASARQGSNRWRDELHESPIVSARNASSHQGITPQTHVRNRVETDGDSCNSSLKPLTPGAVAGGV